MKNDQYFPLEVNLTSDERVAHLIEKLGVKGFGIYILLLMEIRKNDHYACGKSALKAFSRANRISGETLNRVINDFNLFKWMPDGDSMTISSPYMLRVMKFLDESRERRSNASKTKADKMNRNPDGTFTVNAPLVKERKEEKSKEATTATAVVADSSSSNLKPLENWEIILNDLSADNVWMEKLAIHSGLGQLFLTYETTIVEIFREHIALHGSGCEIQSQRDMRTYFANFLRPGTPTSKRLTEQLHAIQERDRKQNTSLHETIDPITGERSYFGHIIPPYAPLRPTANAYWDDNLKKWIP